MRYLLSLLILVSTLSCVQDKKPILGETDWQKELNAEYKDATTSPLKAKDRKHFEGLDFFKFDSAFVVVAQLERTPDSEFFNMKTTTNRLSQERIYGILTFQLNGETHKLNVYQGKDLMVTEGYEDYLFLPFLDDTNGEESYGGGRYIDLRIPEGDTIVIDFNKAYNPYCAYSGRYSCPIPPKENHLDVEINAGVKKYKDSH